MVPPPDRSTLFPYTTLFRSIFGTSLCVVRRAKSFLFRGTCSQTLRVILAQFWSVFPSRKISSDGRRGEECVSFVLRIPLDRKSTRLNSSHPSISYAVFCLIN